MKTIVKSIFSFALVVLLIIPAYAHEFAFSPQYGYIVLKWDIKSDSKYYLAINGEHLNSSQSPYYASSALSWEISEDGSYNCSSYIDIDTNVNFSYSTVDFCTPTQTWWDNNYGEDNPYGATVLVTTSGLSIKETTSMVAMYYSSGLVEIAQIYMRPSLTDEDQLCKSMAHEIGHVWGFGHSDRNIDGVNDASIMRQGPHEGYVTPRAHDYADLIAKYSS